MGSCFTEHIGNHLQDVKFNVLQNPNGILFDPLSVCRSLVSYIHNKQYTEDDLFISMNAGIAGSITAGFQILIKHSVSQPLINRNRPHMNTWKRPTGSSSRSDLLFAYKLSQQVPAELKTASTHDVANCPKVPCAGV